MFIFQKREENQKQRYTFAFQFLLFFLFPFFGGGEGNLQHKLNGIDQFVLLLSNMVEILINYKNKKQPMSNGSF